MQVCLNLMINPVLLNVRENGAILVLSFAIRTKQQLPCDRLKSLIVLHAPPQMLSVVYSTHVM